MPLSIDQILPSLQALGMWSYWIIGFASLLEAFFITGVFVPGTLIVDAGGILVQNGALDFFDLVWFVAIGSVVGGEVSYWAGILARRGIEGLWEPAQSRSYQRAERLFCRRGGLALVIGRFLGPISGLIPFAAAVAGMDHRRFAIWNIASAFPFALAHVAFGYFLGNVIAMLGPLATRVAVFAGAVVLAVALLWWLVLRIERMLPFILSVGRSIIKAIGDNRDVRAWALRHPRMSRFAGSRFGTSRFSGLPATLLAIASVYIFVVWLVSVAEFLMADPIVQADVRLANLIHIFWTPGLLRFFAHVTALGDMRVVGLLYVVFLALLFAWRRRDLAIGMTVSLAGDVATVTLLKAIFHRPRPVLAYFMETSGSFPSGHAAISVAFYGILFYIAWRLRRLGPIAAALLAANLAFMLGLSRLYLIEHYLTDILNGWLVGALWLLIGITVAEWWRETRSPRTAGNGPRVTTVRRATIGLAALLVLDAGWLVATYDKARNVSPVIETTETVADIAALFSTGNVPISTESVTGNPLEPVNFVILAKDRTAFSQAMMQAGWVTAEQPTLSSLGRAAWVALTKQEGETGLVTPYFWDGRPNDFGFQRPTEEKTLHTRHRSRFWETRFVVPDGRRIFVGAAGFDNGLARGILHHIDPNIDAERDTLESDLTNAGVVNDARRILLSPPRQGESVVGDPWFTDGEAVAAILQ